MAALDDLGAIVRRIIETYAALKPSYGEVVIETVFDEAKGHYELMHAGWNGNRRIHGSVLHLDIIDGKVWIQHDGTEQGFARDLKAGGVPRDHIMLTFQHMSRRRLGDYAAA